MKIVQTVWRDGTLQASALDPLRAIVPKLILAFGSAARLAGLAEPLAQQFPQSTLLGCTTAGEITTQGVSDDSCVITALQFDSTQVHSASALLGSMADSRGAGPVSYTHLDVYKRQVETDQGQCYTWRDLDRGTALLANFLESLDLPAGSRIAVQVEKSVEALMLYLATLRAGFVYLPLNTAYQSAEMAYFIGNAEPALVVCASQNFGWLSKLAFQAGTPWVFTLNDDRTGSLLERCLLYTSRCV